MSPGKALLKAAGNPEGRSTLTARGGAGQSEIASAYAGATDTENVEPKSALYSDALKSYDGLGEEYAHQVIDHAVAYVDGQVHTNGRENFWSLLKRGIHGTYVSVEPYHLFRYVDEQAFRFNNRQDMNDADRFDVAMKQIVGKRLTYAELIGTGKVIGTQTIN